MTNRWAQQHWPHHIQQAFADAVAMSTPAGRESRALEVGTGSGRMTRLLLTRLPQLIGVDLSYTKLHTLATKVSPAASRIVQADCRLLPLAGNSFDAVITIHVLHLIPNVRQALAEFRRVLRPGGVFLRRSGGMAGSAVHRWMRATLEELLVQQPQHHSARALPDLELVLDSLGGQCTIIPVGQQTYTTTPAAELLKIQDRVDGGAWAVPTSSRTPLLGQLARTASNHFGSLSQEHTYTERFELQAWRFQETQDG